MQRPFRPSDNARSRSDVVSGEWRILGFVRHGYGVKKPVHFESVGIKRVLRNLARNINEQSVIDIESLAGKWRQAGDHSRGEKNVMNVLTLVGDAVGR
jgi:hypothetical protein